MDPRYLCEHEKIYVTCEECTTKLIAGKIRETQCPHRRLYCITCDGICAHKNRRSTCPQCPAFSLQLCEHENDTESCGLCYKKEQHLARRKATVNKCPHGSSSESCGHCYYDSVITKKHAMNPQKKVEQTKVAGKCRHGSSSESCGYCYYDNVIIRKYAVDLQTKVEQARVASNRERNASTRERNASNRERNTSTRERNASTPVRESTQPAVCTKKKEPTFCDHGRRRNTCKVCDPANHLRMNTATSVRASLKAKKSIHSNIYLNCSYDFYKEYLGPLEGNHIDHIIPMRYGNPTMADTIVRLNYRNTQLLLPSDNLSKSNRLREEDRTKIEEIKAFFKLDDDLHVTEESYKVYPMLRLLPRK